MKRLPLLLLALVICIAYAQQKIPRKTKCQLNNGICIMKSELKGKCNLLGFSCRQRNTFCCEKGKINKRTKEKKNEEIQKKKETKKGSTKRRCKELSKCSSENGKCVSKSNNDCTGKTEDSLCRNKCTCCIESQNGQQCKTRKKCSKKSGKCVSKENNDCKGQTIEGLCKKGCTCCIGSGTSGCQCGQVNKARIVGGNQIKKNKYPWMVGLYVPKLYEEGYSCGGTIIKDRYVITAAHCLFDWTANRLLKPDDITVGIADHNQYTNGEDVPGVTKKVAVEKLMVPDKYDYGNYDEDIGLIKLRRPLDFADSKRVKPVCLPSDDTETYEGKIGTVIGWGYTSFSGNTLPSKPREVSVPILSPKCEGDLPSSVDITDNMLCAGYKEGGKDACNGDSGGPLVVKEDSRQVLVGIVSFGFGCADPNVPGVYTRVTSYLDWIRDNTGDGTLC